MKKLIIIKRNRDWFFISLGITLLGYVFFLEDVMLIGVGCLIMVFVDFLSDYSTPESK